MTSYTLYRRIIAEGGSVERMSFFSDAVFAIAMTLLIIEIHAPAVAPDHLTRALLDLLPEYLTFLLSFVVVGLVWLSHHRKVSALIHYDQNVLRLNLLMLLFVASIPLPTAILARYGDETPAVVLYAATVGATGFTLSALWVYAWTRGYARPEVTVEVYRYLLVQSFPIPGFFLLSIPIALAGGALAAQISWIVAAPTAFAIARIYRSRRARRDSPSPLEFS